MRRLLLSSMFLLAGCRSGGSPPPEEKASFLRGDPETSGPRRASAARPRPGAEPEASPHEDRLLLDQAMLRAQAAHREGHAASGLALDDFSHPACAALDPAERRRCPLSEMRWSRMREVEGGVELELRGSDVDATRLRWQFLCHIAFEKSRSDGTCPLGAEGLAVSVVRVRDLTTVRLTSDEPARVGELRRSLRKLISAR